MLCNEGLPHLVLSRPNGLAQPQILASLGIRPMPWQQCILGAFRRPQPPQKPGPNGQIARKSSVFAALLRIHERRCIMAAGSLFLNSGTSGWAWRQTINGGAGAHVWSS
jgi:hypothetical protein